MKKYIVKIAPHTYDHRNAPTNAPKKEPEYLITAHRDFHFEDKNVRFVISAANLEETKRTFTAKAAMMGADVDFILADEA